MRCDDLDPFFDGELADDAAAAFRDHLAGCERCQRALRGRMLEAVVVSAGRRHRPRIADAGDTRDAAAAVDAAKAPGAIALQPGRRAAARRPWLVAAGAAIAAAAIAILWLRGPGSSAPAAATEAPAVALQLAPRRGVDVRFAAPALDTYRPRNVVRGAALVPEKLSLKELAALEQDLHAVVGALALTGNLASAGEQAALLPRDAASLSDRAALALLDENPQKAQANAERALALAVEARRLDRGFAPAMWNEAVALERLELPLAAAEVFEALGAREPGAGGWFAEAAERAADLRRKYRGALERYKQLQAAADRMAAGGAPLSPEQAAAAPSMARSALHVAIAATADPARLAALAPLADALGVAPELAQARGADPARRMPIARELAGAVEQRDPKTLRAIRARARAAGQGDIVRAIALLLQDEVVDEDDLAELAALPAAGPWWRLVAVERQVFYLTYRMQRYADADLAARDVAGGCTAALPGRDTFWCPQILRTLAASNAEIGRVDHAYRLAGTARQLAHDAGDREEEGRILDVIGQIAAERVAELDPGAIADGYMREFALRAGSCAARLYQLDFGARAAFNHHRFGDAERLLGEADRLADGECKQEPGRYNAETIRLRLLVHRPTAQRAGELARRVRGIEEHWGKDLYPENRLYNEFLLARARFALDDGAPALAALSDVIARAQVLSGEWAPRAIRAMGHAALAEHAARRGDAEGVLAALAARMGVQLDTGCTVGVSHDDRVTVVVRGATGRAAAEVREVPEGQRVLAAPELLSRPMRERLAGCASIEVLATGPYFGAAGLLGPDLRWTYRSSPRRATGPLRFERQVVVTDVEPPAELGLPPLRRMQLGPGARILEGKAATPAGVLDAIDDAELVVINAHGVTDANEPAAASLVLSPDAKGSYWLTADRVKQAKLAGAPVVILAACDAGRVQVSAEPWSLASSFLAAGARAVIAPTTEIADDTANAVFESIVQRMRAGKSPEQAVAEEREASGGRAPWLANVVVFQ